LPDIHIVNIYFVNVPESPPAACLARRLRGTPGSVRSTGAVRTGAVKMGRNEHLGEFEQLALLAVLRLGDDAYGARIQDELEAQAGREASVSSIYITLTRLETKGLVSSWMGAPTDQRGGKARRYFKVEAAGTRALAASRDRLLGMWDGVEAHLEEGPS